MNFSSPFICILYFLFLVTFIFPIKSSKTNNHQRLIDQIFRSDEKFHKLNKTIKTNFQKINRHAVKTIQSPDGDIIDCVLIDKQPAFDHPLLKGQKISEPPKIPKKQDQKGNSSEIFQSWNLSGESCPKGTIPIRRIKKQEIISIPERHYEVITYEEGAGYYGAKAALNVWAPQVEIPAESSAGKIWVVSQSANETIEAGWQVCPKRYGDSRPRLFVYWTVDGYRHTGCFNLECPGFVQISKRILIGGPIAPVSEFNGQQRDFTIRIEQDQLTKDWWLEYGGGEGRGEKVGYWPYRIFSQLKVEANVIQFGGEVVDLNPKGDHTSTFMGSGHFADEGFRKAAYIRNMKVLVAHTTWVNLFNPEYLAATPHCYNIKGNFSKSYGNYIYYGGPGRNNNCR